MESSCNVESLMEMAACLLCLSLEELSAIRTSLMCEIVDSGVLNREKN